MAKLNFTREDVAKVSESERKRAAFVDELKGKPYAKDIMGRAIRPGDIIVFGTGSASASGLYFGLVEKINYTIRRHWDNKTAIEMREEVSSVTCKIITVENGTIHLQNRRGVASFGSACILDDPPKKVLEAFLDYVDQQGSKEVKGNE